MFFKQKAFTLLEVLVVLVIVSLISTLLLQGFGYTVNLRSKVLRQLGRVQNEELTEYWFRQTTSSFSLREKQPEEALSFQGSAHSIKGESLVSLDQPIGVISPIEWHIESTDDGYLHLYYRKSQNQKKGWLIATWLGKEANFSYLDPIGNWHSYWPVEQYPEQLPTGIMLNVAQDRNSFFWYSRIIGEKKAPIIFRP